MERIDYNTISHNNLDQLTEQIRLSYAHVLKLYLQIHTKYKQIRRKENELSKYFPLIDQFLYDKAGKLDWNNVRLLIPPNLEYHIKMKYHVLNMDEIKLCCLLLFNVPYDNIADILPFTQKSAHTIAYRIKRKTGMNNIKITLKSLLLYG